MPGGANYIELHNLLRQSELHTVCEEARCPNIGDCWDRRSATFMILDDICTRRCHYCAVTTGKPLALDLEEPQRLARTVEKLALRYCVITSVNRDDLPDGGAFIFAQCIRQIRKRLPDCEVEVLIPDFQGEALRTMMNAEPDVLNHNIETVERVFHSVRPKGGYRRSLELLAQGEGDIAGRRDQVRDDGRPGRRAGRDSPDYERPARRRLRPADHRPVSAAISQTPQAGEALHAPGV